MVVVGGLRDERYVLVQNADAHALPSHPCMTFALVPDG
jgi:hypothetical protein